MRQRILVGLAALTLASTGCSLMRIKSPAAAAVDGSACTEKSRAPVIDALITLASLYAFGQGVYLYREGQPTSNCVVTPTNPTCGYSEFNSRVGMTLAVTGAVAAVAAAISGINGAIDVGDCKRLGQTRADKWQKGVTLPKRGEFFAQP